MALLSTTIRLLAPPRSTDQLFVPIPRIPRTLRRCITGRPNLPLSFRPPPARRNFESVPSPSPASSAKSQHDAPARRPTNRQIPFPHVYLLDPTTQKRSATMHSLDTLLATYVHARTADRQVIELLTSTPDPIVRVTTRAEVEAQYRAAKRALKRGIRVGEAPKEVQLTWGVARADVEHKLRKAARDLDKGYRVVVVISVKRTHRLSSRQELVAFADEIAEALSGAGEEYKEREVTNRLMVLSFRRVGADEDVP